MAAAKYTPRQKRFFKLTLIVYGVLVLSVVGLHIWFVNNARSVLVEMVHTKSQGKIKLKLSKLRFDFISNKLQIQEADLRSTDSISQPATYHIQFRKLTFRVNSFWKLLVQKKLLLDSISLHDPRVEVLQWRKDTSQKTARDELSVTQEMGKIYNSMLDALDDFGIRRIIINNAQLSLINKMKASSEPVTISNIYFDLKRTAEDPEKRDAFVNNKQSIELRTHDQNITLPGGRHRLSFKNFHLELLRKHIQLDSCTISALATDSTKSSYTIFFKKLMLVGADFEAMYLHNLIRADSVYCEDPLININLNTSGSDTASKKGARPDPERIIQELTGDLDLAFIGVKNAGILININGKKNRSLFNSNNDDFNLYGLRINADSAKPVVVKRFDMLMRDYRLYNEDSSASYAFDSIHFSNNKIVLRNFLVATEFNRSKKVDHRDFKIPYFEITGLDWNELIFQQKLVAREANLNNAVINYKTTGQARKGKRKTNLFSALQSIADFVTLNKVNVVNGQINLQLGANTSLTLQNANLSLFSNQLLQSKNGEGLRRAVDRLSFTNGFLKLKTATVQLQNVHSTPDHLIHADRISLGSANNTIKGFMSDVDIDNVLLDDVDKTIVVDGIRWQSASVSVQNSSASKGAAAGTGSIQLKNITANNTQLKFGNGKMAASTFVSSLQLASLLKDGNKPPQVNGLLVTGKNLAVNNKGTKINAAAYQLSGQAQSFLSAVRFEQIKGKDSLRLTAPRIGFTADVNALLAKDITIADVEAQQPVFKMTKWNTVQTENAATKPTIRIDRIRATEPNIHITLHKNDSVSIISLPGSENSVVQASDLLINNEGVQLGSLTAKTTAVTFVKPTGEVIGVEKGVVEMDFSNLVLSKKEGKSSWSGLVNNLFLQNPNSFSLGKVKSKLLISQLSLGNLNLSSANLSDVNQLLKYNVSAWLRTGTGQFIDSNTTFNWYNAEYSYKNKTLSLDSFYYHPTQPRDSMLAHRPFQFDFITFRSGPIKITDFNLEKYKKDSALQAGTISFTNPVITVYRDKLPPSGVGKYKPLPVAMIQNIRLPVSVKKIDLHEGTLTYVERNAKTRAEGTILLTHINGDLSNIKNRNITERDSLLLNATALLMDSVQFNLRVRESYTDSLKGFLMTLRMNSTSLSFINPMLAPVANVVIKSGTIDSFHMRAIGREDLALGEMSMYYRDLKIKLVKDGDPNKSGFFRNIASGLANTFVIKRNNNGRKGVVYYERQLEGSFWNYIIKMTLSGLTTSVGVKKNRKYMKAYQRELKERSLPPIEFE